MPFTTVEGPQIDFDELRSQIQIEDVLAKYTVVPDHRHSNFRMPCPLHHGDRDNFRVDADEGKWYCYVCKEGGDVINLVAAFEKCRNIQAAKILIEEFGVDTKSDAFIRTVRRTARNMKNWKEAQEVPQVEGGLPETVELYAYRDFSKEAIDHFGLRLIPGRGWGEGIFIPMKLEDGTIVGYSVRHYDEFMEWFTQEHGKKCPKYLNTEGLKKQGILFGLVDNISAIKQSGFAYLVEGQFDCISLWDRGIKNVVGVMGSDLSVHQAQVLMRYTSRLVLMFDGDKAGQHGTELVKERFGSMFSITSITLPPGTDPATADLKELGVIGK